MSALLSCSKSVAGARSGQMSRNAVWVEIGLAPLVGDHQPIAIKYLLYREVRAACNTEYSEAKFREVAGSLWPLIVISRTAHAGSRRDDWQQQQRPWIPQRSECCSCSI